MASLDTHPTVIAYRLRPTPPAAGALDGVWLRALCLKAGAADVGFVSIDRAEVAGEKPFVLQAFPQTRTLISIVTRLHPEAVRTPARSVGNLEFHRSYDHLNEVGHQIAVELGRAGVGALNPASGFPMEMDQFPGRIWVVSHKPVAEAAGLGRMGIHRNVIHPKFGNFINLATILIDRIVDEESRPLDYTPCLGCKLCVAACPVGAIGADGEFNFSACMTHNYREFLSGFTDYVETVATAGSATALRAAVTPSEHASMWQSLAFGPNYKAAYCIAVCPAGEDVIGPYLADKRAYLRDVVEPLTAKLEPIYVSAESDAEAHVMKRFPHKIVRRVRSRLRVKDIAGFLLGMKLTFQRQRAAGLNSVYHFSFTGREKLEATVIIRDKRLTVTRGLEGVADLRVTADAEAWLQFVFRERGLIGMLLSRKLRIKGRPQLLSRFGQCFA